MNRPLVLFLDVDHVHGMLYSRLANRFGWDARIVSTAGSEAVEAISSIELPTMDAIVMAMDGNEIHDFKGLRRLRSLMKEQRCYIPVLAATAYALPEERRRCLDAGIDAYLRKPFTIDQLEQEVIELMMRFPKKRAGCGSQ